jgi:crossover junction endodeoxyribonuclease RusA
MIEPIEFVVFGKPKPQGSKKAVAIYRGSTAKGNRQWTGRSAVVEQRSELLTGWRDAVLTAATKAISCGCGAPDCLNVRQGFPWDFPVTVRMVFTMPKPARAPWPWPAGNVGDLDKLARSTGDALTDAGLWADDCRVVEYGRLAKVYPDADPESLDIPGARIRIAPAPLPRALIEVQDARGKQRGLF